MTTDHRRLTSGVLLARNIVTNAIGGALPAAAALFAVPILVHRMGDARFGVLALVWTVLGYFSVFDLGIGRASTHAIARRVADAATHDIAPIVWSGLALLVPVGLVGGVLLFAFSPWLVQSVLHVPADLTAEGVTAFRILAFAIPFTVATAVLRGALEAMQRFGIVNALRTPYGLLLFLGPVAAVPFSRSLVPAVAILTIGRAALTVAHVVVCARIVPAFWDLRINSNTTRSLLGFGGWMTVSNLLSPLMNTLDRFVIGAMLSVTLVAYYATPHELVTKMWLFTAAVHPVFFPAFAMSAVHDANRTAQLFDRVLRMTFAALFLPTLLLVLLAPDVLQLWLGHAFVLRSTGVLQVLALAVFVNTLGQGALTLIQSLGRPDLTGKFHLAELPGYLLLLWWLLPRYGILGVAVAWAVRAIVDAALLMGASPAVLPQCRAGVRRIALWTAGAAPVVVASAFVQGTQTRLWLAALMVPVWCLIAWRFLLTDSERQSPARLVAMRSGE
jgi:O-antigen/teichoic acid export membrane protein